MTTVTENAATADRVVQVQGYCSMCTANCATVATVENGRVTRLDADPCHPTAA